MHAKQINHPKYGLIINPSWNTMEECFSSYNTPPDPDDYINPEDGKNDVPIVDGLQTVSIVGLKDYLKNFLNFEEKERIDDAWQDCFGTYYGIFSDTESCYSKLTKDELIYFILQCENHGCVWHPSFFTLLPGVGFGIGPVKDRC